MSLTAALRVDNIRYSSLQRPTPEEEEEEEGEEVDVVEEATKEEEEEVDGGMTEVVMEENRLKDKQRFESRSVVDQRNNLKQAAKFPVSHQNSHSVTVTSDLPVSKTINAAQVNNNNTCNSDSNSSSRSNGNSNNNNSSNNKSSNSNGNSNSTNTSTSISKVDSHDRARPVANMRSRSSASSIANRIPLKNVESADPRSSNERLDLDIVLAKRSSTTISVIPPSFSSSTSSVSSVSMRAVENVQDGRTVSQPPRYAPLPVTVPVPVPVPARRNTAPTPAPSMAQNKLCEVSADGTRDDDRGAVERPQSLLSSLQSVSLQGDNHQSAVVVVAAAAASASVVTTGVTKNKRGRPRKVERIIEPDRAVDATDSILFSVPTVSKSKRFWSSPAPTNGQTAAQPLKNSLCVSGPEGKEIAPWVPVPLPVPVSLPLHPVTAQSSSHTHITTSLPVVSALKLEEAMPKKQQQQQHEGLGELLVSASSLKVAFDNEHEYVIECVSAPQHPQPQLQRRVSMRNRK